MPVTYRGRACPALTFRRVEVPSLQPKGAADGVSKKSLLSDSQGRGCAYSCHKFPYTDDWGKWRLVRGLRLLHEYENTDTIVVSSRAKRQGSPRWHDYGGVGDTVGIYCFHWRYPSRSTAHRRCTTSCTFPATPRFPPRRSSAFVMSSCRVSAPEPLDAWLPSTSVWSSFSDGNPYRKKDGGAEWLLRKASGSISCGEFAPVLKNASRLAASTWSREAGDHAGRPGFLSTSTEETPV